MFNNRLRMSNHYSCHHLPVVN
ncbi:hypothetical protein EMIT0194MI4_60131 [Pseudomonas sp. IT-194MI4]